MPQYHLNQNLPFQHFLQRFLQHFLQHFLLSLDICLQVHALLQNHLLFPPFLRGKAIATWGYREDED